MFSGDNKRKVIVISILAVLFIGYMLLDKSGLIAKINLPKGDEWYFDLLDLILPLAITGLAIWKRNWAILCTSVLLLFSIGVDIGIRQLGFPNTLYYLSLSLVVSASLLLIWHSLRFPFENKMARLVGLIPLVFGVACLALFPLDSFYTVLIAITAAVIAFCASAVYFSGRGEVLAIAAFLIMAARYTSVSSAWLAWLLPLFVVTGYFLIGYHLAVRHHEGVDSI
ncbi:MAG: hypothetical protein KA140_03495 [Caldisericia bacterium]|nr:hypothetical protein [Caldisericia bacterium]